MESYEPQNPTILIIDDYPQNLKVLGTTLSNNNYDVIVVVDGNSGIRMAREQKPDLILLDVQMPEKNGFEVCKELKQMEETSQIPVIFLTSKIETEDIVKGFESGGVDYITKPFNPTELLARVKTHIEIKNNRQLLEAQKKELKELNATKNKFLAIIAHDLKSPIGTLLGFAEIFKTDVENLSKDETVKYAEIIYESANRTSKTLQNLLFWALSQQDRLKFDPQNIILKP